MNVLTYESHKIYHDIIQGKLHLLFHLLHLFFRKARGKAVEKLREIFENLREL